MKLKVKIRTKILISILTTTILVFVVSIGYVSYYSRQAAFKDAEQITNAYAREYANLVRSELTYDMGIIRSLAQSFEGYKEIDFSSRQKIYMDMLKNELIDNPSYLSVWLHWEMKVLDTSYTLDYGRARTTYFRKNGDIRLKQDTVDLQGEKATGMYHKIKTSKKDFLSDPYFETYGLSQRILEASLCSPIMIDTIFKGLAGIDLSLNRFQQITESIKPYQNSYAFLVANNGCFVTYPDTGMVNKSIADLFPADNATYNLLGKIRNGEPFSFIRSVDGGKEFFITLAPIQVGNIQSPWALGIVVPVNVMTAAANFNFYISIIIGAVGLLLLTIVVLFTASSITCPLRRTTEVLRDLDKGIFNTQNKLQINTNDEIGEMAKSVNTLIEGLNNTTHFASEVGEGNLDAKFTLLSEHDVLGNALLEMRKRLLKARQQEEKRKKIEAQQIWATNGVAKFAEILRQTNNNMEEFCYHIISNLVKYLDANQGGIFLLNDNNEHDKYLELLAAYAYDRRKFIERRIEIGENLVGRCFLESETIYLTEIPQNYIYITSGLGEEAPRSLLIIPLKLNDVVFGVIELASFKDFELYQTEFCEKIGESIASTISNLKINIRTAKLLEESRLQSEELAQKEEEMRQNMEEMRATQEETARREAEMHGLWNALNTSASIIEYDVDGNIIAINDKGADILSGTKKNLMGRKHSEFKSDDQSADEYSRFWDDLCNGKVRKRIYHAQNSVKEFWIGETYTPIIDEFGNVFKILNIGVDITDSKKRELKLLQDIENLKNKPK